MLKLSELLTALVEAVEQAETGGFAWQVSYDDNGLVSLNVRVKGVEGSGLSWSLGTRYRVVPEDIAAEVGHVFAKSRLAAEKSVDVD